MLMKDDDTPKLLQNQLLSPQQDLAAPNPHNSTTINNESDADIKTYSAAQNLCGMLLVALFLAL